MEPITSAVMLKWSVIMIVVSLVITVLGGIRFGSIYRENSDEDLPGLIVGIGGCVGMAISALTFFISLFWHIVKSIIEMFTGG